DVDAHVRASGWVILPELVAGQSLAGAGVEPGGGDEPDGLLAGEDAQDVRAPPGRLGAMDLAHLVEERPRGHPHRRKVALGIGRLEARDADRRDETRALLGDIVELAEVAVVADRVAADDHPRGGQAVDGRPDRRGDAAGLVDDHQQLSGMLAAEALLELRRESQGTPVSPLLHGEALGRGVAPGEVAVAAAEART